MKKTIELVSDNCSIIIDLSDIRLISRWDENVYINFYEPEGSHIKIVCEDVEGVDHCANGSIIYEKLSNVFREERLSGNQYVVYTKITSNEVVPFYFTRTKE